MRCTRLLARRVRRWPPPTSLLLPCAVGLCLWASSRLLSANIDGDALALQRVFQRRDSAAAVSAGDVKHLRGVGATSRPSSRAREYAPPPDRDAPRADPPADGATHSRQRPPPVPALPPAPPSPRPAAARQTVGPIATSERLPPPTESSGERQRTSASRPYGPAAERLAAAAARTFGDLMQIASDERCKDGRRRANDSSSAAAASGGGLAVVIVLRNLEDSVPLQTAISAVAFTPPGLLSEVVFAYASRVSPGYLRGLVGSLESYRRGGLALRTMGGVSYYAAAISAATSTSAKYVALVHDSIVFAPGWVGPLLEAVAAEPLSAAMPHVDALLPNLVYTHPYEDQVYAEVNSLSWRIDWGLAYRKHERPYLGGGGSRLLDSAATVGDALLAQRGLFELLGGAAAVGSFVELSFLAWMCGGGMRLVGCSRVLKVNKYFVFPPRVNTDTRDKLARLYLGPRYYKYYAAAASGDESAAPRGNYSDNDDDESRAFLDRLSQRGCRSFEWYAREVVRLPFTDLPIEEADRMYRIGQLQNAASQSCYAFDDGGTATEVGSCYGLSTLVYTTRDGVLHLQSGCLVSANRGSGHFATTVGQCNDARLSFFKLVNSTSVITDGEMCLVRKASPKSRSRFVATPSGCPAPGQKPSLDMQWSLE